jgi:hypothetical protein
MVVARTPAVRMPKPSRKSPLRPADASPFSVKQRKATPHEFVLEALAPLSPRTHPMFGCLAVYIQDKDKHAQEKIVLILRDKPTETQDNGVWLATTKEHHQSLQREFPSLRSIKVLGKKVTGWQVIPSDASGFEESAMRACELVQSRDPRIGKVTGERRARKSKTKVKKRAARNGRTIVKRK